MGVLRRESKAEAEAKTLTASAEVIEMAPRRAAAMPYGSPRPIVASAERVELESAYLDRSRKHASWQPAAWLGYDKVGEIHYGFNLVSNILSRLRVFAGVAVNPDEAPVGARDAAEKGDVKSQMAIDADEFMRDITGPAFGALARTFGLNMNVPGECYLVRIKDQLRDGSIKITWKIVSTDELEPTPDGYLLRPLRGDNTRQRLLPKGTFVGRIWRSHPRYSDEPDSSMVGVAEPIEELLLLSRLVRSASRSRLNNGLLFLPDGLVSQGVAAAASEVEIQTDEEGVIVSETETVDPSNALVADLMEAIVTAVGDEGDPSAVAPFMVTGEGGLAEQIKHITFQRQSDDWLVNRTERALERVLQGIDVPKEVVTGLANVKYSNALVIDENLYKANIEPLALVLVDALTELYLRPLLRTKGYSEADVNRMVVWYDPSEIVTRPNQAQDSSDGYDRMLVGPGAWRREHGFSDDDAPTESELAMMLLTSGAQLPPDVQQSLLQSLLPTVLGKQREAAKAASPVPFPAEAEQVLRPTQEAQANVSDAATGENAA